VNALTARGRPRSSDSHARILAATTELLETTPWSQLSVEAIAARARVGKNTIYKWWGGKPELVMEAALAALAQSVQAIDTGNAEKDLVAFLKRATRSLKETFTGRTLAALIAEAQQNPEFAQAFRERFVQVRGDVLRSILERGVKRGELRADVDVQIFVEVLVGAFWYRLLSGFGPLNDAWVERVVAAIRPALFPGRKA
jgi:AcrR family transcriptional regulator